MKKINNSLGQYIWKSPLSLYYLRQFHLYSVSWICWFNLAEMEKLFLLRGMMKANNTGIQQIHRR